MEDGVYQQQKLMFCNTENLSLFIIIYTCIHDIPEKKILSLNRMEEKNACNAK